MFMFRHEGLKCSFIRAKQMEKNRHALGKKITKIINREMENN